MGCSSATKPPRTPPLIKDGEDAEPDEIEEKVRRAVCDGGKAHTILYPSAVGISMVGERYRDNAIRYIEAGLKYGRL